MGQIKNIKLHIVTDIKCPGFDKTNKMAAEGTETQVKAEEQVKTEETPVEEEIEFIRDDILDTEEMKKIYVRGIAKDATDEEFKEFFETHCGGTVTDVAIIRKEGEQKYYFGFVTFAESELIDELLLKRDDLTFKETLLNVNRAVPKNNNTPGAQDRTKKLFIANVPRTGVSENDLLKYFKARHPTKYGTLESVELVKKKDEEGNKTEENRGFGFVMVSSEDMADKMCIQHATFEFGGRKIELKKSSPPGEGRGGRGGRGQKMGGGYGGGYGGYGGYGGGYAAGGYGAYGGYGAGGYGGYA